MSTVCQNFALTAPLFLIVLAGYLLVLWGRWPKPATEALSRFVFVVALPAMLFRMMSHVDGLHLHNWRVLAAFFGSCMFVYLIGRLVAGRALCLDAQSQSIFALGGVYSNVVLLGLPMAQVMLGNDAIAVVSYIILFNALLLWTLVTVSIEWTRYNRISISTLADCLKRVICNPIVAAILLGVLFGLSGLNLPVVIDRPLSMMGNAAAPLALFVLGMSLANYGVRDQLNVSITMTVMKLCVHPAVAFIIARLLSLSQEQTQAVVLLASVSLAANVYLASATFNKLQAPVASCMVLSTLLVPLTMPLIMALVSALSPAT